MKLQVLSHAGLLIESTGKTLLCDPWLIGSTYWRSWWNYPPVSSKFARSLKPDFIYLTHIHWDHFQSNSLRLFDEQTPILVPKGNYDRIKRDLNYIGFPNVIELNHGERYEISPGFTLTSYQFGIFLDSAAVVECEGKTIFNVNDAKFMGLPLRQILKRHPKIDFLLRSHSSANSRLCYQIIDNPEEEVDNLDRYIQNFCQFALATGARYAIPFASNHCHLHRDAFHFNQFIQTPLMVRDYVKRNNIDISLAIMASGDSWTSEGGFDTNSECFFEERVEKLNEYQAKNTKKLEKYYAKEENAVVELEQMQHYFKKLHAVLPFPIRYLFKGDEIVYVLKAGEKRTAFGVDLHRGRVRELEAVDDGEFPIQVHTAALIMKHCLEVDLFSHLPISKRVIYRVTSEKKKKMKLLNLLFNMYEYDLLPLHRLFTPRSIKTWCLRWREILLYISLTVDWVLFKRLDFSKYLKPVLKPS
ncbi:MAG: MBL fold metallo-hydrolase [Acidobacteriota bacterium]|nr:MBL fold metallo-hydrolase [Acidobacteriota bacterium]